MDTPEQRVEVEASRNVLTNYFCIHNKFFQLQPICLVLYHDVKFATSKKIFDEASEKTGL